MLITELEGSGYLCPMGMSHLGEHNEGCECKTTECMAWRWYDKPDCEGERRGYCGMAGKPQWDED
ncbi:hypothetical protein LJC09_03340 [Desulfovibrio sp. OttesenSCG-928-F20]|nr:hypothetical protein [Desulfovibrio sp. OttesenSCG-928-M16]MDL2291116.1 hypothetical protein [Desulfovibrio sp. OttesenSCG-928-F20]